MPSCKPGDFGVFRQVGDDPFKPTFLTVAKVRAGMHHHKRQTKFCGELNFLNEGFDGVVPVILLRPGLGVQVPALFPSIDLKAPIHEMMLRFIRNEKIGMTADMKHRCKRLRLLDRLKDH